MRTKSIAAARGVSERTVGNQLQSAYRKLGVKSRAELAVRMR
jgi:DNA-binding CsgD family transcriptional regulator